jgi:hypothetical protein
MLVGLFVADTMLDFLLFVSAMVVDGNTQSAAGPAQAKLHAAD